MAKCSVIVCTHNPRADYFIRTLESLRMQVLPADEWELLLIDNASDTPVMESVDLSWHPASRCVREEEMGLTPARLCGIREATSDLLVFVDDDNVLAPDYLEKALEVIERHSFLGVVGAGVLKPEFETQPSPEVKSVLPLLALRTESSAHWSNNVMDSPTLPWGAGLCVRRDVANYYEALVRRLSTSAVLDRRGQQLFSGGDDLFSWAAAELGYGFGIFPQLRVTHLISAARLEPAYFLRLIHDHSFSHGVIRYLLAAQPPLALGLARRIHILLHGLRNGSFSMKCHLETARGETEAARFLRARKLQPLPPPPTACSTPNESELATLE